MMRAVTVFTLLLAANPAGAQDTGDAGRAAVWVAVGALLPLLAVTATAFAKLAVVLGILRGGLGVPGVLPAAVMTGLAAVLALVVMTPTGRRVGDAVGEVPADASGWLAAGERAWPPLETFLERNTDDADRALVSNVARRLDPGGPAVDRSPPTVITAFLVTELTAAFEIGVLLLLPFLVIDLLVANTLAVLGFALLPPPLVALPFKLLLFVAAGGWGMLVRGLAAGYA